MRANRDGMLTAIVSNGAVRAMGVLAPFITVPIVAGNVGTAEYGAYVLVTAVAAMLPVAELGLSLGMMTALTRTPPDRNHDRRRLTSTAFVMQLLVAAAVATVVLMVTHFADWVDIFGIRSSGVAAESVEASMVAIALIFVGSLPATLVYRIALGTGRAKEQALWQLIPYPVIIVAVVAVDHYNGGLQAFVLAVHFPPLLIAAIVSVVEYAGRRAALRPTIRMASSRELRQILGFGVAFTVSGLAGAIGYQTDALVLSRVMGPEEAAIYGIAYRVSSVAVIVGQGLSMPLWPAFGSLLAAEDYAAARRLLLKASGLALCLSGTFSLALLLFGQTAVEAWVGAEFLPPRSLLLALAGWALVQASVLPLLVLITCSGAKRFVVITTLSMALVNLATSIALTHAIGLSGPAWASAGTYVFLIVVPSCIFARRLLLNQGRRGQPVA